MTTRSKAILILEKKITNITASEAMTAIWITILSAGTPCLTFSKATRI